MPEQNGKPHLTVIRGGANVEPLARAATVGGPKGGYSILVRLAFDRAQIADAIAHGRAMKWTHERDGDWGALLLDTALEGKILPIVVEVEWEEPI